MSTSWSHTAYAQRIHFGLDVTDRVAEVVRSLGGRRVLLVASRSRLDSEVGERVARVLGRLVVSVFDGARPHVPARAVQSAVAQAAADGVDAVVSLGGGSAADLGKAVCFFAEQQQQMPGTSYTDRPLLTHVTVPTTYTGAAVTPTFAMTDDAMRRKSAAGGPTSAPLAAVCDPILSVATPVALSAQTAMTALSHGIEAACSPDRTPEAEALALACIGQVASALPQMVGDPDDLGARTRLLQGAVLGGRSLQNSGTGLHHALAQLLGGRTGLPDGLLRAILLAPAANRMFAAVSEQARRIGQALGDEASPADAVDGLRQRAGLPAHLKDAGVAEEDLEAVARMASGLVAVPGGRQSITEEDVRSVLAEAW